MTFDMEGLLWLVSVWALPVLTAITLHEAAHGWVAWKLGDDTARLMGRVTFNPLKHIDRFGTVLLPCLLLVFQAPFLFGYARPVPVRFQRLRRPRRDMVLVAAAGPAINLLMALVAALSPSTSWLSSRRRLRLACRQPAQRADHQCRAGGLQHAALPPLDGGRVVTGFLPPRLAQRFQRIERYGIVILCRSHRPATAHRRTDRNGHRRSLSRPPASGRGDHPRHRLRGDAMMDAPSCGARAWWLESRRECGETHVLV